jgi:hypothetical protein
MFEKTWSSIALMYESLCGTYSMYSSQLILLNRFPHCGRITLDLVLSLVSSKAEGWTRSFFVVVLMTCSTLGAYSNYLMVLGEEPSPISIYFIFGALDKCLVVGFLDDILPTTIT